MTKNKIESLKELLSTSKKIVIVPHKNPDGDAIGSTLALNHYLKGFGHNTIIITPNDYPDFLKWMPGEESILVYESNKENAETLISQAELIFTLDFNALNRTGSMELPLQNSEAIKVMIDHHQQPDDYAEYIYSDNKMSSTCEMVYNFIEKIGNTADIDEKIATCLYSGIVTDTGSFRFPSTTAATHRVIADLIEKGAKNNLIHNSIYDTNSYNKLQLLGCALNNLKLLPEFNTAYITLSQEELNKHDFKKGDTEGFVNYGLSLKGIVLAVIFIENHQENIVKISFRSKESFSVNDFARKHYNGGGHTNAAGGRSENGLEQTVEEFITILADYKIALNS